MKKFFAAVLVAASLLIAAPVSAEIQTFEGVGEYYIPASKNVNQKDKLAIADDTIRRAVEEIQRSFNALESSLRKGAYDKAVQDVRDKASVYVKSFSLAERNVDLSADDIAAITSDALKINRESKAIIEPSDNGSLLMRVTVTATIDSDEITKWLDRPESERKAIIAQDKDLQKEIAARDRELAELKKKLAEHERLAKETPKETKPASTQQVGGQIFVGVGEYRLGSSETIINAEKGAKILAMQNALEQAGILVDNYAQVKDFELDKSVITTKSRAVLKVLDAKPDWKDFVCRTTVKVEINVAELNKWLEQEAKKSK